MFTTIPNLLKYVRKSENPQKLLVLVLDHQTEKEEEKIG